MLNDGYVEQIVKGRITKGMVLLLVVGIALAATGLFTFLISTWGLTLILIGVILIWTAVSRREVEFEYLMVNDDVEIARIVAKQSRKKLYSFDGGDVKLITKLDSIYRDNEHQANPSIVTRNFTEKSKEQKDNIYVFILNRNNHTEEVILELSEKTLAHVNYFFKGKYKE